jgi:hypothetical protein
VSLNKPGSGHGRRPTPTSVAGSILDRRIPLSPAPSLSRDQTGDCQNGGRSAEEMRRVSMSDPLPVTASAVITRFDPFAQMINPFVNGVGTAAGQSAPTPPPIVLRTQQGISEVSFDCAGLPHFNDFMRIDFTGPAAEASLAGKRSGE